MSEPALIWDRPERAPRPVPVVLSRESIVRAAIELADIGGLTSVTLRKVAGALGAGPMRLYGYVSTKEELLTLMVDAVYGEMLARGDSASASWRGQVTELAHAMRLAAQRHLWFAALLGGRPHQGPNALAFLEAMLSAVANAPHFDGIETVFQAAKVINGYVLGTIHDEAAEDLAVQESGLTKAEWQRRSWPYLERMIATGRFPMIAKVAQDVVHRSPEEIFERGLDTVLEGIAREGS